MENKLFAWIMDKTAAGLMCFNMNESGRSTQNSTKWNFIALNGWFDRFMKRKRLTIRRITISGREFPRDAPIHINKFLTEPYMQMEFDNFDLEAHLNFLCSWTNFKITNNLHSFFYLNIFFVYTKCLDGLIEKQIRRDNII